MSINNEVEFKSLFERYYAPLCRFAYTLTEDTVVSEELVQDLFVYLWENRNSLVITSSIKSYLFSSVRNLSAKIILQPALFQSKRINPMSCKVSEKLYHMLYKPLRNLHVGRDRLLSILRANNLLIEPKTELSGNHQLSSSFP